MAAVVALGSPSYIDKTKSVTRSRITDRESRAGKREREPYNETGNTTHCDVGAGGVCEERRTGELEGESVRPCRSIESIVIEEKTICYLRLLLASCDKTFRTTGLVWLGWWG